MLSWIAALPIVNATPTMSPKINRIADTPWWLFTTLRRQRVRPDAARLARAKSSPWRNHKRPRMARRCPIPEDCWIPEMRWKYEIKEDSRRRTFWSEAALGRGPSLHGLRRGYALIVRPLHRYYS